MAVRDGSHGRPCASVDARLYIIRRLAGQLQAQLENRCMPLGSSVLRRVIMFPSAVYEPQYSQVSLDVVPSSLRALDDGSCLPVVRALPVIFRATSSSAR